MVQCPVAATRKHCFAHYFIFTVGFFFPITGQIQIFCTLFFKLHGSVNWTNSRRQSHSVAQSGMKWKLKYFIPFSKNQLSSCCPDTGKQAVKLCTKVKSFWSEYVIRLYSYLYYCFSHNVFLILSIYVFQVFNHFLFFLC